MDSEIVEHGGDAVGPLLQCRQRARRDGIRHSGAGWSKKMSRPSDVIALIHPCIDGSSDMSSQLLTHIGTNTMSRSPLGDAL